MKTLINLFLLLLLTSCASKSLTWAERKRECHNHYLNGYGIKVDEVLKLCSKELGTKR